MSEGTAFYNGLLYRNAAPIAFTNQAVGEHITTAGTYQINTPARQVIDYFSTIAIFESGNLVYSSTAGEVTPASTVEYEIDYLFGTLRRITPAPYPAANTIRVNGSYIPRIEIGGIKSYNWTPTLNTDDTTSVGSAAAGGSEGGMQRTATLHDFSMTADRVYLNPSLGNTAESFLDSIFTKEEYLIETRFLNTPASRDWTIYTNPIPAVGIVRAWVYITGGSWDGSTDATEAENVTMSATGGMGTGFEIKVT